MLLYASFALLGQTAFMWTHLLLTWSTTFLPNMWWQERSLMCKSGWAAWAARSGFLLPALLPAVLSAAASQHKPDLANSAKTCAVLLAQAPP